MIENSCLWIVSDVDGTLMDHSYDLTPAKETIKYLQKLSIPVILCTSKTAAEVKVIRKDLNLSDPYIVENGAAIYGSVKFSSCLITLTSDAVLLVQRITGIDNSCSFFIVSLAGDKS